MQIFDKKHLLVFVNRDVCQLVCFSDITYYENYKISILIFVHRLKKSLSCLSTEITATSSFDPTWLNIIHEISRLVFYLISYFIYLEP